MSRHASEPEFGSDSFLDVVANIVGILIILIVIAGVRVSRAPQLANQVETADAPSTETATVEASTQPLPTLDEESLDESVAELPEPELPRIAPPPELPPLPPLVRKELPEVPSLRHDPEWAARERKLQEELEQARAAARELRESAEQAKRRAAELQKAIASQREQNSELSEQVAAGRNGLSTMMRELLETEAQLEAVRADLREVVDAPDAQVIEHRVTPIGRIVDGKELHFLLSGNRVAPVPVDDLAARLGSQIQRQKEMLLRVPSYEGIVGPVDGFQMRYLIERSRPSLSEELRLGPNVVRMSVTRWVLEPTPDLQRETAEEALRRGSAFYNHLLTGGHSVTLTLWVYSDSFELCRQIQEFGHRHGYDVAARPLPDGVPITGSPNGSRSFAQ